MFASAASRINIQPLMEPTCNRNDEQWLPKLLECGDSFFQSCPRHRNMRKNETAFFCVCCPSRGAMCRHCLAEIPAHHDIIQIRRYVYCNVVRVAEISKRVDLSGIQTYTINQAKVVFLRSRPPSSQMVKATAGAGSCSTCSTCRRCLRENCRFCSLECKFKVSASSSSEDAVYPSTAILFPSALQNAASDAAVLPDGASSHSTQHSRDSSGCASDSIVPLPPKKRKRREDKWDAALVTDAAPIAPESAPAPVKRENAPAPVKRENAPAIRLPANLCLQVPEPVLEQSQVHNRLEQHLSPDPTDLLPVSVMNRLQPIPTGLLLSRRKQNDPKRAPPA